MPVRVATHGQPILQSSDNTKTYRKWKKYYKNYKIEHKEKYKKYFEEYNSNPMNKARRLRIKKRLDAIYPWRKHFYNAKRRCYDRNLHSYGNYNTKKVKFLLTMEDVKNLWVKCKAHKISRPVIHRINNNGNYEYLNCKFVSFSEHSRIHAKERWKSRTF